MKANMETHKVRFFEAHCRNCNETFSVPLLSNITYGEFILKSEDGNAFAYMNGIIEKNFTLISNILEEFGKTEKNGKLRKDKLQAERLQWIIAHCADEIDGKKLTTQFICPNCHSTTINYSNAIVVKDEDILVATFDAFNALSENAKRDRVFELFDDSKILF